MTNHLKDCFMYRQINFLRRTTTEGPTMNVSYLPTQYNPRVSWKTSHPNKVTVSKSWDPPDVKRYGSEEIGRNLVEGSLVVRYRIKRERNQILHDLGRIRGHIPPTSNFKSFRYPMCQHIIGPHTPIEVSMLWKYLLTQ